MTITTSDGQEIPVHQGEWVFWAPSGEPVGCMYTDARIRDDVAKAVRRFWGDDSTALRKLNEGYRAELMTRARWEAEVMPRMLGRRSAKGSSR